MKNLIIIANTQNPRMKFRSALIKHLMDFGWVLNTPKQLILHTQSPMGHDFCLYMTFSKNTIHVGTEYMPSLISYSYNQHETPNDVATIIHNTANIFYPPLIHTVAGVLQNNGWTFIEFFDRPAPMYVLRQQEQTIILRSNVVIGHNQSNVYLFDTKTDIDYMVQSINLDH